MRKIGPAPDGVVRSPLWSYQFGLQSRFVPIYPRFPAGDAPETLLPPATIACLTFVTLVAGGTYPDTWKRLGRWCRGDGHDLSYKLDHTYKGSCFPVFARCLAHTFAYILYLPPRALRSIVLYLSPCDSLFPPYIQFFTGQ
ncbi:hypothetical protein K438DRAFT_80496 [Mycena galopus ATCC 62051]|nr:hypothetical protein K438DRAFT_80496 [Mycena galopus ATCC 62051]